MDRWEFEQICIDSRLKPIFRHDTKDAVILIADGWFEGHPERPYPHHRTVWAIGDNESNLKLGRDLYFEGAPMSTTVEERRAAACEDALVAYVGIERARETIAKHLNPQALYDG